jgi:hypothetical protein
LAFRRRRPGDSAIAGSECVPGNAAAPSGPGGDGYENEIAGSGVHPKDREPINGGLHKHGWRWDVLGAALAGTASGGSNSLVINPYEFNNLYEE